MGSSKKKKQYNGTTELQVRIDESIFAVKYLYEREYFRIRVNEFCALCIF